MPETPQDAKIDLPVKESQPTNEVCTSACQVKASEITADRSEDHAVVEKRPSVREPYTIFTRNERHIILLTLAVAGLASPINSSIIFPAIPAISRSLNQSVERINITVTVYLIIQAVSPSLVSGACDTFGRRNLFLACLLLYVASNIGLALQNNYVALLLLRMVQSAGASPVIALGAGSVSDISTPDVRGRYMGFFQLGVMFGPAIAPFLGAVFTQVWGWHAIFYFLIIVSAILFLAVLFFLPETLRSKVGNGSIPISSFNKSIYQLVKGRHPSVEPAWSTKAPSKPFSPLQPLILLLQPDVALLLLFSGILYGVYYAVSASLSTIYQKSYGLSELKIGLTFLSLGMGSMLGAPVIGRIMDKDYRLIEKRWLQDQSNQTGESVEKLQAKRKARKDLNDLSDFPIEAARLRTTRFVILAYLATVIALGWCLEKKVNLAIPIVLEFLVGFFGIGAFSSTTVIVVDVFPKASASSSAANNFVRCLIGAAFVAFVQSLLDSIHIGWSFTFFSLLLLVLSPLLLLVIKIGPTHRAKRARAEVH